jgi:hypothetical protein
MSSTHDTNTRVSCAAIPTTGLTIEALLTDTNLDGAFDWLCQRRKDWPPDADVWQFRRNWPDEKARLRTDLLEGTYQVELLQRVVLVTGEEVDLWSARDSLVMKMLALTLPQYLPLSNHCVHLKGHGGSKDAVRRVMARLPHDPFVLKTDVQSYYASIDHQSLLDQLAIHIADRRIMNLIGQYLLRCAERGGLFWEYKQGIALGCPLSPIIGAFFLSALDVALEQLGLFYVRFMDDILVLAPTRWKLRNAVKVVNEVLGSLKLQKHPDKTYIGRVERGFDFLGYHLRPGRLTVAKKTFQHFVERARRLYEQERGSPSRDSQLGAYVRRWIRWCRAGLSCKAGFPLARMGVRGLPGIVIYYALSPWKILNLS